MEETNEVLPKMGIMVVAAPTQKGATWKIGYGSLAYTATAANYEPQPGAKVRHPRELTEVQDKNDETVSVIVSRPCDTFEGSFLIGSSGAIDPPVQGDVVTLVPPGGTSASWMVIDADAEHSEKITKLNLSLKKWPNLSLA